MPDVQCKGDTPERGDSVRKNFLLYTILNDSWSDGIDTIAAFNALPFNVKPQLLFNVQLKLLFNVQLKLLFNVQPKSITV